MAKSPLVKPMLKTFPRRTMCALIGLPENAFKTMRLRDLLPMRAPVDTEEEADARGYDALQAFLTIVSLEAFERHAVSRERARFIGMMAFHVYGRGPRSNDPDRWPDVARTSAEIAAGRKPSEDILLALIDWPDNDPMPKTNTGPIEARAKGLLTVAIGTFQEIAQRHPRVSNMIAVSLTHCAAILRQRADEHDIDLGTYWEHG